MGTPRTFAKTFVYNGKIYTIGGQAESKNSIEVFGGEEWSYVVENVLFPLENTDNLETSAFTVLN